MAQNDFGTIDPNTKSGTALASDLNDFRDAVNSNHSGTSQPSYQVAGMVWVDNTSGNLIFKAVDGAGDDIGLFQIDASNNIVRAVLDADGDSYLAMVSDDVLTIRLGGGDELTISASAITPQNDDAMELGSTSNRFADLHITQINSGPLAGFRNRIINGDFQHWQRGTSFATAASTNTYFADRWFYRAAASGRTISEIGLPNLPRVRIQRDSGDSSTGDVRIHQIIESADCYDLAGETITVSFDALAGGDFTGSPTINILSGTALDEGNSALVTSSWTGFSTDLSDTFTPTGTFQRFSFTATLGASVREVAIRIGTGAFSGTAGSNDFLDIKDVQLETGSTATPFERRPYGTELALCQRYYWRSVAGNGWPVLNAYAGAGSQAYHLTIVFPAEMRVDPTLSVNGTWSLTNCTGPTASLRSTTGGTWFISSSAAGRLEAVPNSADDYIDADAEL